MELTPTAQFIVNTMNDKALKDAQAIKRVRELHRPDRDGDCVHCATIAIPDGSEYLSRYPCQTIKALDGEQ